MRITIAVVALIFASLSGAQASLQRVPSAVDYEYLLENPNKVCNECIAILSGPAKPGSCPLALVRSVINAKDPSDASINAVYFCDADGNPAQQFSGRDRLSQNIPAKALQDTGDLDGPTSDPLKAVVSRPSLSPSGTVLVPKGTLIDTSLLVKHAGENQFVIEQASPAKRFAANLNALRERTLSQELAVFDFSPQSNTAVRTMGAQGLRGDWQSFSARIPRTLVGGSS